MTSPDYLDKALQLTVELLDDRGNLGQVGDVLAAGLRDVEDPRRVLAAVVVYLVAVVRTTLDQAPDIDFDGAVQELAAAVTTQTQESSPLTLRGLTQAAKRTPANPKGPANIGPTPTRREEPSHDTPA